MWIEKLMQEPSNTKSEEALIGIILQNEMLYYNVRAKSEWFYDSNNSKIFKAIEDIKSKNQKLDISLLESYVWESDKLYDIYSNIYSPSNLQVYENDIYSWYVRRNLIRWMKNIIADCYDSDDISKILSKLSKTTDFWALSKNKKLSECVIDIATSIWQDKNFIWSYWYRDLDKALWWYMEWQLVVIWARPWVWKTLVWCNLIDSLIKSWVNGCFFTLEMTANEISKRILSKWTWVSMRWLDIDKSKTEQVQIEAAKVLESWYDFEIVDWLFDYHSICIEIKRQAIKNDVKVVYIDYLWLIDYADWSKTDNTLYSISQITKWLKRLAKEMWITIVLLSQLNRDGANGKPHKAQLRSSWSIEQDADVIILLYQDYQKEEHEKYVEFIIDKNRNWIETSLYLWVSKKVMMIYDVDQEECIHL